MRNKWFLLTVFIILTVLTELILEIEQRFLEEPRNEHE